MKTRILTGVIAAVAAIAALLLFPSWAVRLVVMAVCVIAMHELLAAGGIKHKGLMAVTLLFAAACPLLDILEGFTLLWITLMVYIAVMAVLAVVCAKTLPFEQAAFAVFSSVMVVLPLSSLAYIRAIDGYGLPYLFLTLIVAWCSDTGAYFTGSFLGKHKLCEHISPKKTVEGFLGGIVCSVLIALLAAFLYQLFSHDTIRVIYWQVALVALVAAPISVVGDLFCSIIKRYYGIKDYGKLFPGHGGVLDRFDSLVFVAPLMYFLCSRLSMIELI